LCYAIELKHLARVVRRIAGIELSKRGLISDGMRSDTDVTVTSHQVTLPVFKNPAMPSNLFVAGSITEAVFDVWSAAYNRCLTIKHSMLFR